MCKNGREDEFLCSRSSVAIVDATRRSALALAASGELVRAQSLIFGAWKLKRANISNASAFYMAK